MTDTPLIQCDLCVIGSGMAGMSAALFAARQGLSTVMVGRTGEIIFSTGLLDLMAEMEAGIARWLEENPRHKHGKHNYSLEQFGLTRPQVNDVARPYHERFDVPYLTE